jgi:hypothetical protein
MARAEVKPPVPTDREVVLSMDENEARYVRAALMCVNPSREFRIVAGTDDDDHDPVYEALSSALREISHTWSASGDLKLLVPSGNKPEGTP